MDIAYYSLKTLAYTLTMPSLIFILFIIGFILYTQNKRTVLMQKMVIGKSLNSPLELTISSIVMGICGGIIGTLVLSYLGVIFDENSGIELLFIISIVFMFWKPRFICFAYSGAALGLISLFLNEIYTLIMGQSLNYANFNINIVALMTMVGVLHIIEGFLIMFDGHRGSIPVFSNRDEKIVGGFALKRYWPMPIVILLMSVGSSAIGGDSISTPGWWPLINGGYSIETLGYAVIAAMPIYGVLGYNSVTFTRDKREKSLLSGVFVLTYGIVLSLLAQVAAYALILKIIVLLFAPIAHELMIRLQKYMEVSVKPLYSSEGDGIVVLEVAPDSLANNMGIKSGDRFITVNGDVINDEKDIVAHFNSSINYISFIVRKLSGEEKEVNFSNLKADTRLGIVFVPKFIAKDTSIVKFEKGEFKEMLDNAKKKNDDEQDDNDDDDNNDDNGYKGYK